MEDGSTGVEDLVSSIDNTIDLVVDRLGGLAVKHQVADSVVGISHKVVVGVYRARVHIPVFILTVASFFMGIDHPVKVMDEFLFVVDDFTGSRGEVERHAVVSLDAHKLRVHAKDGVRYGARPEVSVHLLKCPIGHY